MRAAQLWKRLAKRQRATIRQCREVASADSRDYAQLLQQHHAALDRAENLAAEREAAIMRVVALEARETQLREQIASLEAQLSAQAGAA